MGKIFETSQEEEVKMEIGAICQFCGTEVKEPVRWDSSYECECGSEYWTEDASDVFEEIFKAEEEGREIKILEDYDLSEGERIHLVFSRPKDTCYGD